MPPDGLGIRDDQTGNADIAPALFQGTVFEVTSMDDMPAQVEAWAGIKKFLDRGSATRYRRRCLTASPADATRRGGRRGQRK
ncbi:hypothetical protein M1D97_05030 [Kushneria sp. AK178]